MKFEIIKGLDYTFYLVIKQDGSTTVLPLIPADTARVLLSESGGGSKVAIDWVDMTQDDPENGKFIGVFSAEQTKTLETSIGFKEDGYPTLATYQVAFDTNTAEQGNKVYVIDEAYVKDVGI